MFETYQICPYTGLRSFTEEESIYFKGREDDIDQACNQLQRNKFLMLTGASGDGKSSLIYAGIIPNARAGFLKSKYSQWCVADFRPERSPFDNLCKSIARELGISNHHSVEAELNHGFSALVDLYKNSNRYIDTQSSAWEKADNATKTAMRNEAANLIVLVDQFEEFFTNPENYHQGAVSNESSIVVNLLLETARIALEEDLPIYIIFTMRSDYIGQCAAFRGLPEYIGFSQFFVPHLNRSQLQQVIEEPAALSGNRITRRLTERLIHDVTEGVDQLPILQHALNQIWVAANSGSEEMDLVHYAMVGGMKREELPSTDVEKFNAWFDGLPPEIKAYYQVPSLQNVLDTHTNKLYIRAHTYAAETSSLSIPAGDARNIIRTAFTCLTKIDQGRAVRNRMTLREITNILGSSQFDFNTVGSVLNSFREPGNTFIRPFINPEDPATKELHPDQVLDITHESLIRNWQYLGQWAKEEFDSYSIYKDFEQQLRRWVKSDKAGSFLLPIGPLTFFESWYKKARPNEWWIARYLPENTGPDAKLRKGRETLAETKEFLARSARKHIVSRTFMRYGSRRMAITISLLVFLTFTSFVVRSYFSKQNAQVIRTIHRESLTLASNPKAELSNLVRLLSEEVIGGQTSIEEIANSIQDPFRKIAVMNSIASVLALQGQGNPLSHTIRALSLTDSLLDAFPFASSDPVTMGKLLSTCNDFRGAVELAYYYKADPAYEILRKKNAKRSGKWVMKVMELKPDGFTNIVHLNMALANALNYQGLDKPQLDTLRAALSPFENGLKDQWLQNIYSVNNIVEIGGAGYGIYFNGLYQQLAYLYAADGDNAKVDQCIDTLLKYNQSYYQGDYSANIDNAGNIAAIFYLYGKLQEFDRFVEQYSSKQKITKTLFLEKMIARRINGPEKVTNMSLYFWTGAKANLNLQYMGRVLMTFLFEKYRDEVITSVHDSQEKNFLLALSYKNQGILNASNRERPLAGEMPIDEFFNRAIAYYEQTSNAYREEIVDIGGRLSLESERKPRSFLFLFPDDRVSFHPFEPRSYAYFYSTDVYMKYILDHGLLQKYYPKEEDLIGISDWLLDYHDQSFAFHAYRVQPVSYQVLQALELQLRNRLSSNLSGFGFLHLYLGSYAQQVGDTSSMIFYYNQIQRDKLLNLLRVKQSAGQPNDLVMQLLGNAIKGLSQVGHRREAQTLVEAFKKPVNRSSLYAYAALHLFKENAASPLGKEFLDSAMAEMHRVEDLKAGQPNRQLIAIALCWQNPSQNLDKAFQIIKNLPAKFYSICGFARALAYSGQLYKANSLRPPLVSDADMNTFLWNILVGMNQAKGPPPEEWKNFVQEYFIELIDNIIYIDESN